MFASNAVVPPTFAAAAIARPARPAMSLERWEQALPDSLTDALRSRLGSIKVCIYRRSPAKLVIARPKLVDD